MRENHSGSPEIMQPKDARDPDEEVDDPFHGETRLRILDIQERRPIGHEIQCISEPSLYLLRARVSDVAGISVGAYPGSRWEKQSKSQQKESAHYPKFDSRI